MSAKVSLSNRRVQKLRDWIAAALREGASPGEMVLRLTLGDASELRRDRTVPLEEIRFDEGQMRFLGVRVAEGGITTSRLDVSSN